MSRTLTKGVSGAVVGLAFSLAGASGLACSSGGGGGDAPQGVNLPTVVSYDFSTMVAPLAVEFTGGSIGLSLYLRGVYETNTEEYTILPGPVMDLDTGALFGELNVSCTDVMAAVADELPTAGSVTVMQLDTNDLITITINNALSGVDLTYDDFGDGVGVVGPITYTWDDFADLYEQGVGDDWEQLASLVFESIEFTIERFLIVVEAFVYVYDNEEDFELAGSGTYFLVADACEYYPFANFEGSVGVVWFDVNASGELDTGDDFMIDIDDCWIDDPGDDVDSWLDGLVHVNAFHETENPFTTGASIVFERFIERETSNDGMGDFVLDSEVEVEGQADVLFVE